MTLVYNRSLLDGQAEAANERTEQGNSYYMPQSKVLDALSQITNELKNFEEIAVAIKPRPGSIPSLDGIDVYGEIIPLNGIVGGDHLIYMDFKKRFDPRGADPAR